MIDASILVTGIFVGLSAGYLGSLMVLKRMALVGDALSHVALPGLALGILFNFNPIIGAFVFLFASAVITWELERLTKLSIETIIGAMFVLALSVGILITPEPDLLEALFGNISKVGVYDAIATVIVSTITIFATKFLYKRVVIIAISEDLAISSGMNVAMVSLTYLLLVSMIVAVGIKIVGTLLVGALVIVPAAAAKNVSPNLSRYAVLSSLFGVISIIAGMLISEYSGLPTGPVVVLSGIVIFVATIFAHRLLKY